MLAVKTTDLTKKYGKYYGIDNVDLAVEAGETFGIVGSNGAGKTTLLRLLMNFIFPSAGSGNIFGNNIVNDSTLIKETTGYVPEEVTCYPQMKAGKYIKMAMRLHGIKNNEALYNLLDAFAIPKGETFDIMDRSDLKATGIAAALAIEPRVLLLDEPTVDLSTDKRDTLFKILAKEKAKGTTIIITAANEDGLGNLCDRIATMEDGAIVYIKDAQGDVQGAPLEENSDYSDEFSEYSDPLADTIILRETPEEEAEIEEISIEEYLQEDEPQEDIPVEEATVEEEAVIDPIEEDVTVAAPVVPEPVIPPVIPQVVPVGATTSQEDEPEYTEGSVEDFLAQEEAEEKIDLGAEEPESIEEIEEDTVNPKVLKATVKNIKAEDFENLGMAVMSQEKGKIRLAYNGDLKDLAKSLKELGITDFQTKNKNLAHAFGLELPPDEEQSQDPAVESNESKAAEIQPEPTATQEESAEKNQGGEEK